MATVDDIHNGRVMAIAPRGDDAMPEFATQAERLAWHAEQRARAQRDERREGLNHVTRQIMYSRGYPRAKAERLARALIKAG